MPVWGAPSRVLSWRRAQQPHSEIPTSHDAQLVVAGAGILSQRIRGAMLDASNITKPAPPSSTHRLYIATHAITTATAADPRKPAHEDHSHGDRGTVFL